jgi:CHASE3 domain sensor protein
MNKTSSISVKVMIAAMAVLSFLSIYFLRDSFIWLEHTYQVIDCIHQTRRFQIEAQDSVRGYILSHKPFFLSDHNRYFNQILPSVDQLEELVKDNPKQTKEVKSLRKMMNEKVTMGSKLVSMANVGNFSGAQSIIAEGNTEMLASDIDNLTGRMLEEEYRLLAERKKSVESCFNWASWGIPILFIVILIVKQFSLLEENSQA